MSKNSTNDGRGSVPVNRAMPWPTDNPRAREEWDFRTLGETDWYDSKKFGPYEFLPEVEVKLCHCYETRRNECQVDFELAQRESCGKWKIWQRQAGNLHLFDKNQRDKLVSDTFDALLEHYYLNRGEPGRRHVIPEFFYQVWPEWPQRPFLTVAPSEGVTRYNAGGCGSKDSCLKMWFG